MPTSHFTDDGDASETGHGKHSGRSHGGDRPGGPRGASASRRGPGEARSCAAGNSGDSGPSGRGLGGRGYERLGTRGTQGTRGRAAGLGFAPSFAPWPLLGRRQGLPPLTPRLCLKQQERTSKAPCEQKAGTKDKY